MASSPCIRSGSLERTSNIHFSCLPQILNRRRAISLYTGSRILKAGMIKKILSNSHPPPNAIAVLFPYHGGYISIIQHYPNLERKKQGTGSFFH